MIPRTYFMLVHEFWDDGNGSYTYRHSMDTFKSWLPNPNRAYDEMLEHIKTQMKYEKFCVMTFNRV